LGEVWRAAACPVGGGGTTRRQIPKEQELWFFSLAGIGGRPAPSQAGELWCSFRRAAGEAQRRHSNSESEYNNVALRHLN